MTVLSKLGRDTFATRKAPQTPDQTGKNCALFTPCLSGFYQENSENAPVVAFQWAQAA